MNAERDRETPWVDPIVAEVRAARATPFAAVGYDLEKLVERMRREQTLSGHSPSRFGRACLNRLRAKPRSLRKAAPKRPRHVRPQ